MRDPLCEQALATNRELRLRVDELERRLTKTSNTKYKAKLTAAEVELRELRASPWTFLPWKGYVS